jgi:folate-binding protein YgfZ
MSSGFFVRLKNRGAVIVSGPDQRAFLQGLITNDINLLDTLPCIYACLLTPQGKFLYDFFVTKQGDGLHLECEGGARTQDLMNRLNHFKLRSKVTLELSDNIDIYYTSVQTDEGYADPRHTALGFRTRLKPDLPEQDFSDWDSLRISLTIPDGSRDLDIEKSTLEDARIDMLNGVSYTKGCYLGQELTARIHHRGLAKRHLYALQTPEQFLPAPGADITSNGKVIGEMKSSCGSIGLALIRDDAVDLLPQEGYRLI